MVGDKTENGKGLIPRICEALFEEIEHKRAKENENNAKETGNETLQHKTIYSVQVSSMAYNTFII